MKKARQFITHLHEHTWVYHVARLAFWIAVASFVVRWIVSSAVSPVCSTDTLYGFLEISCKGFPFADVISAVLYFFTNIALGSIAALLVMVSSIDTAIRYVLYSPKEVCPAFVTENINGQMVTLPTQLTCPTFVSVLTDIAQGVGACVFVVLALVYGLHLITQMRTSSVYKKLMGFHNRINNN